MNQIKTNPFIVTFGKVPPQKNDRTTEIYDIMSSFDSENPDFEVYILTGPRGVGKPLRCLF